MKKIVAGGFLFLGGSVMYAVGALVFAYTAYAMRAPQVLGIVFMLLGVVLGIVGSNEKD